jgi:hypothetical protein
MISTMGVLFDYFAAASDQAAASAISLLGGPGAPPASPAAGPPFDTVPAKGIDPLVQLGTLEALLTGRDYERIVTGPRAGHALATQDGGQRLVVTLTDELQAALAEASDARLASVAVPWSQTEEFFGQGDPQILTSGLHELAELARRARTKDERLYCWICV